MKALLLASAIVLSSVVFASADDTNSMHGNSMHDMNHHHNCMTVRKTVHMHGKTVTKVEKVCH